MEPDSGPAEIRFVPDHEAVSSDAGPPAPNAFAYHTQRKSEFDAVQARHLRASDKLSLVRLISFVATMSLATAAYAHDRTLWIAAAALAAMFIVAVVVHFKIVQRAHAAGVRAGVHQRSIARMTGGWTAFGADGSGLLDESPHPYARDLDVLGPGSLFQRINVTHTARGESQLVALLTRDGDEERVLARQEGVKELDRSPLFRQELEAAARLSHDGARLESAGFAALAERPSLYEQWPWLAYAVPALTLTTVAVGAATLLGAIPAWAILGPLSCQALLVLVSQRHARRTFDVLDARRGVVEAFERLLRLIERSSFHSDVLESVKRRVSVEGRPPSAHLRQLRRYAGWIDVRFQFPLHAFLNLIALWDLHLLRLLESWIARTGRHVPDWFDAIGELEALASLATLASTDSKATYPRFGAHFSAAGVSHPLLREDLRVANSIVLPCPGHAFIVTGSNMAGKSTFLRSVGLNLVLALAGGPVCAVHFVTPFVRVRASMRVHDSLQEGASYFYAELRRIRSVLADLGQSRPVFFLLDELLRGTNERASHIGAKSLLLHLLNRGALGLVATHDLRLADVGQWHDRIENGHFTDTMVDGRMVFDYTLRPGIVQKSNALELIALAGVPIVDGELAEDGEDGDEPPAGTLSTHD